MSISSVTSSSPLATQPTLAATSGGTSSAADASLMASEVSSLLGASASSSPQTLLQDLVSLSPAAQGLGSSVASSSSGALYTPQGLLQAIQGGGAGTTSGNPLLDALDSSATGTSATTSTASGTSTSSASGISQLLKSDPGLVGTLLKVQEDQGFLAAFD